MTAGRKIPEEKRKRIKKVLREEPELSRGVIAKRFNISNMAVYYIKKELKEETQNDRD